jgi:hypothetical protein
MSGEETTAILPRTEPYPIEVTRWVCGGEGCTRSYAKRSTIEAHMETCWRVPENRACLTCDNFVLRACCSFASDECGCRGEREWSCEVGLPVAPGKPQVGCPSWTNGRSPTPEADHER